MSNSQVAATPLTFAALPDFGLLELASAGGLRAQLLPSGALHALRHGETLLNQLLPGPAEDGLGRLLLRWHAADGPAGWAPLAGPGLAFKITGPAGAAWASTVDDHLECTVTLGLHPRLPAWAWRVTVHNRGPGPRRVDVLHAQDLGLADESAVRNNEAYISHYLDLLPVPDPELGWVVLARQNQAMAGGCHPWLAVACPTGAAAFCTDGTQFFGADHRLTGEPAAARLPALPSRRLQSEFALAGLQTHARDVAPGASAEFVFVARYVEDHPAASGPDDLALVRELGAATWAGASIAPAGTAPATPPSLFVSAPWLHGDEPAAADWAAWFPGARRHEERGPGGELLAFFHGDDTHVVSRRKESAIARPHGHILRSGPFAWIDDDQFGLTCYASGVFGAQAYLGNPSMGRLVSVVRNALNVARASGQRVFVRTGGGPWRQLGVPSAFAMRPGEVRWLYRCGPGLIEARVWCARDISASCLSLRVLAGEAGEFLVTHQVVLGSGEFEHAGGATVWPDAGWIGLRPAAASLLGREQPSTAFAIAAADPASVAVLGGDAPLQPDGLERNGPYVSVQSRPVREFGVILLGSREGLPGLPGAVASARAAFAGQSGAHRASQPVARLAGSDPGLARLNEVLPWFAHNAAIHFTAPHGLEQYGGGAWGVRDVCQGSVEWLLAAGEFAIVRRMLTAVFAQQYSRHESIPGVEGCWPQWFMFPPYRSIQQAHSHGDVCFWPVKALCDYVEASNDFAFLATPVGYTDPVEFVPAGPVEPLWAHCDRVIAHGAGRFLPGTALVNYGDGDWDDTLQPADPTMRTHLVSTWTVGLTYHVFRQLAAVCRRAGESARAAVLDGLLGRIRADFAGRAMPGGIVAGFVSLEPDGSFHPLLHPSEHLTGIRYRLLPMTRAMLAELFTRDEALRHAAIIERELKFTDGVRLMSEPVEYHGGIEHLFKRADTAANVGREIGLQYVHAHLRYAEAMAKLGEAERLWAALQVVNPVGLEQVLPGALPRQSNVYFSSSDADFADRVEARARWDELRAGKVPLRAGWRLYSSGPGMYLNKVRSCLLGLRESFGDVIFDPVLPRSLDGLTADVTLGGRAVTLMYRVVARSHSPSSLVVNGRELRGVTEPNPYRAGGLRVDGEALAALLTPGPNAIEITL